MYPYTLFMLVENFVKPENKKVFLTGDALFAYPPSIAQGASQSIEVFI